MTAGRIGVFLLAAAGLCPAPPPAVPRNPAETLRYSVNWPSGLSLGEATLRTRQAAGRWEFELSLDAAVPGFAVRDRYRSAATPTFCSLEFEKDASHGHRQVRETTTFDYHRGSARRATKDGGKSELPAGACARDALDFIFYVRRELAAGRLPPEQTVLFGAPYQVRLEYAGVQTVTVNDKRQEADRMVVYAKGPVSTQNFEIFFSRDAARKPVAVRVPFALGMFSMELLP